MIRLKPLVYPTLYLKEDNSGYTDHKLHKEISDKILEGWSSLLNSIDKKDIPLSDITEQELHVAVEEGYQFIMTVKDVDTKAETPLKIDVLLAIIDKNENIAIHGASLNIHQIPIEVYLQVSENYTVNELLKMKDYISNLAHHEAVHIIKYQQKLFQFSSPDGNFNKKDKEWIYRYFTHPSELHAYISQLNNELKQLKEKYKDITFSEAINKSVIYKRYVRDIFWKNPKIKNKMLSKVAHYWNSLS